MKLFALSLCAVIALPAFAGVSISSPGTADSTTPGIATSGSPVHFVAKGSTSCSKGVASMGLYTSVGKLAYTVKGGNLDTTLNLSPASYDVNVTEWDNCGSSSKAKLTLTVTSGSGSTGMTYTNLQNAQGWSGFALLPPTWGICSTCSSTGPELIWSWTQNISSPSMSGKATKSVFGGGTVQWADVLWNNHIIGNFSSQGVLDVARTLVPTLHNFTYDVYFWVKDASVSQGLEFDINQHTGGKRFIWGHECRIAGGHEWDVWDNVNKHWVATGVPCNPLSGAWNHLIIKVQRTSSDQLLYQSITLNGKTATINHYENPTSTSANGITINYQLDGNRYKTPYTVYIDKLNFTAQ
jgi:hypothetical protein